MSTATVNVAGAGSRQDLSAPPAGAADGTRPATARRPRPASSPDAPARSRRRRARRIGVLAGAAVAAVIASGCNVPVERWVPDFNGDGAIDANEVSAQQQRIVQALQAVDAQRRAVQSHPFLVCVRAHESDRSGGYVAQNPYSSASGAYQFLDSTWRNVSASSGHPGYARALHAPWYVQDAVALWVYNNGGRSAWAGTGC